MSTFFVDQMSWLPYSIQAKQKEEDDKLAVQRQTFTRVSAYEKFFDDVVEGKRLALASLVGPIVPNRIEAPLFEVASCSDLGGELVAIAPSVRIDCRVEDYFQKQYDKDIRCRGGFHSAKLWLGKARLRVDLASAAVDCRTKAASIERRCYLYYGGVDYAVWQKSPLLTALLEA